MMKEPVINKEWIIKTHACYECNLEFCNNNYDNCILIKKAKEQKKIDNFT